MNRTTKAYCAFSLTLVWALSGGCADTQGGKLRPGQGTQVTHRDLRDLETWKLLPEKVQKLRGQYIAALRNGLTRDSGVTAEGQAEMAILLAREGSPEGISYLVKRAIAAEPIETLGWASAIERVALDKNMLKELGDSRAVESRLGGALMMGLAPSPREHPQALRALLEDGQEDIRIRSAAMYALAANASWEDAPLIAEIAMSEKAPKGLREGAKEALARFVGKEYGEKMKVEEFRAYLMNIARQLPQEKK